MDTRFSILWISIKADPTKFWAQSFTFPVLYFI